MNCNTVILEHDGVLGHENNELMQSTAKGWLSPDSLEALVRLKHAGLRIVIASNKPAVIDYDAFFAIYDGLTRQLGDLGVRLDGICFCSSASIDSRDCRTPETELLTDILRRWSLQPTQCVLVGHCLRTIDAATALHIPVIVVQGLSAAIDESLVRRAGIHLAADLWEATSGILV